MKNMNLEALMLLDWEVKLPGEKFSVSKLYSLMAEKREIQVTRRALQNTITGKSKISFQMLEELFLFVENEHKKKLVGIFFANNLGSKSENLLSFIEAGLQEFMPKLEINGYEKKELVFYTDEQMKYLNENISAFKLHNATTLYETYNYDDALRKFGLEAIEGLIKNNLLIQKKKILKPRHSIYKLPLLTSAASTLRIRTEFLFKHVENFINRENYENQIIKFTTQFIEKEHIATVRNQVNNVIEWVKERTITEPEDTSELVPIMFLGFYKEFNENEI